MPITTTETSFDGLKITSVPYSVLEAARSASLLTVGDLYLITDKGDAGIIVDVSAPNRISLRAKGLFLVPDFQDVGTYTTTPAPKGTNQKVWSLSEQTGIPFVNGDIVFWDGIMYQVIDDTLFDTNSPDANASAYTPLTKNVNNGYILECDAIIYDFITDIILYREDKRSNRIRGSIERFQWGNDNVINNNCQSFNFDIINQRGGFNNNTTNLAALYLTNQNLGDISNNTFENSTIFSMDLSAGFSINYCTIKNIYTSFDSNIDYSNCTANPGYSDFTMELDMSDAAIFSSNTLNLPVDYKHIGIYLLINNTGQTIQKITGIDDRYAAFPTPSAAVFNKRFIVQAGNTQSFQNVAVAGAVANTLNADAVVVNTIVGRVDSSDYIEYAKSGTKNIRTNIVKLA